MGKLPDIDHNIHQLYYCKSLIFKMCVLEVKLLYDCVNSF